MKFSSIGSIVFIWNLVASNVVSAASNSLNEYTPNLKGTRNAGKATFIASPTLNNPAPASLARVLIMTTAPTSSPTNPMLTYTLLGKCEGDCDNDDQCDAGLLCFQRDGNEPVPGCSGQGVSSVDYCYDPNSPTPAPTSTPTTASPVTPTANPTTASPVSASPTTHPATANPVSSSPTTASPVTANPTANPTTAPVTSQPTNQPVTSAPVSLAPTSTSATSPGATMSCPPVGNQVDVSSGSINVMYSNNNMLCGIYIKTGDSLIPFARSYDANEWEAAPGPKASPSEGILCFAGLSCSIQLPVLEVGYTYIMLTKETTAGERQQIARFLEFTTFGTKMSEIDSLDDGLWGEASRAQYLKAQMSIGATSHREYFRKRTNSKWDASTQTAKSNNPCSPLSKWRKYTYTKQDRHHTIDSTNIITTFEIVPSESSFTATIHEADSSSDVSCAECDFQDASTTSNTGYSGTGYYDFGKTEDLISWTIASEENGVYPISFRFSQGSSSYNGNRKCDLYVNDVLLVEIDFFFTGSWAYWKYSDLVDVNLKVGSNVIKLVVSAQDGGPHIDHLRVGKPPAVVLKTNGWPRTVAKNGLNLLDEWYPALANESSVFFPQYPDPPQGDLYRYAYGRTKIELSNGQQRYLDIGNPPIEFDGYESYLPQYYFNFTAQDVFLNTASHLFPYPLLEAQELILQDGINHPFCDLVPQFAEEFDAPIFGKLASGEWIQFTPTISLENNGPSINDLSGDVSANVLIDGGGGTFVQTAEKVKCSNVPRSMFNEGTCHLSKESTACSSYTDLGEIEIQMNTSTIKKLYSLSDSYVYAIRGLVMERADEHPCAKEDSRWLREADSTCLNPTSLGANTIASLHTAISSSLDTNEYIRDVKRSSPCDSSDIVVDKLDIVLQLGQDCFTHIHPNEYSVYDFSGWVTNHPGGEYNIMKWAQGWNGVEGWYLTFPFEGNSTRNIPKHPMSRWENNAEPPYIDYIARLGDSILYRDLSNSLKTDAVAEFYGATSSQVLQGGVVVCGSIGEVSNDPSFHEVYDVRSNEQLVTSSDVLNNQKNVIWAEIAMSSNDQLRQRMAWALAQMITVVPQNIDAFDRTEAYTIFYDIFVRHAFGNFRDILSEASYSPLMAEHLSYLQSKSHAYVYSSENKRVSSADENFAREIMQLFTVGLVKLNDDGTVVLDRHGKPAEVYTNEDIESFARAWTGFDRTAARGNIEEASTGSTGNRVDPMQIVSTYRDAFPKSGLGTAFIGDGYILCDNLREASFLKKGAKYRLLGGSSSPELMKDPSYFAQDATYNITRAVLDPSSQLFQRLENGGNYQMNVVLENDLMCNGIECEVDTLRVVKVGPVYYEYVERPCVQLAFYNGGKQIQLRDNDKPGQMCANPALPHARSACCRQERFTEVNSATMELGVGYFYDGERTTYSTAKARCIENDLCVFETVTASPENQWWRKGYHWTNNDCAINVKINSEGYIALVHDIDSSNKNTVPYHVEETNTLNWFRVFWDGTGEYPGSSPTNDCASNQCKVLDDGSCLCKASVTESTVFESLDGLTKIDIFSNVFIGSIGPAEGSTSITGYGFKAHVVAGSIDESTVFEIVDKGRTFYLKNVRSTVNLQGWETMPPQIIEAESAILFNVTVKSDSSSASGGSYVDYGTHGSYVEWNVNVDQAGQYLVSFRHALHSEPRPLSLIVNGGEITHEAANPTAPVKYYGGTPSNYPLERCAGDCDNDNHCNVGLICHQNSGLPNEEVPGCSGYGQNSRDYCVDPNDYTQGILFMPTGDWSDSWLQTQKVEISLVLGVNTIRLQIPTGYYNGPNIDSMKIESVPAAISPMSFRNPPHFMSLAFDYSPYGVGEQNTRDAQYETAAVLDHYFYHDNVAPFLCIRIIQRFGISNPSPRYVSRCVSAFQTGLYESGSEVFGDNKYGSLESTLASILLDSEATSPSLGMDPGHGALREPILQVMNLLRSMEHQTKLPDTLDGPPMENNYHMRLWKIDEKIGQGPYEFPSVFSFFLPEYIPDSGPVLRANLVSPESMLLTMPNTISLLNGMFSLIKYGLSDCNEGFSSNPGYASCTDNGLYERSFGHLMYSPNGATVAEYINDMALLLTAGRLSDDNRAIIEDECNAEPDNASITRCVQQLIISTGEFHSTSQVTRSGEDRPGEESGGEATEPYKAIVYFYLNGGCDSYNMLTPHTCSGEPGDTVYDRYRVIRGKSEIAEGVGLPLNRLHEIPANNPEQPCTSFGIHENLSVLKDLYDQGQVNFVANAGLLAKPVDTSNYRGETPAQLFAHNAMTLEAAREDLADNFSGTGVGGRIADVMTAKGVKTNTFSIDGQQILLTGQTGTGGPFQYILSSNGLATFNADPSIDNMNEVIKALNDATTIDSGFFAETWSSKLTSAIEKQHILKTEVDSKTVTTSFPDSGIGNQLKLVTQLMQTAPTRGASRDIFYVSDGGYDTHSDVDLNLVNNFGRINNALQAFVDELNVLNLWDSTALVQFSEFARTLDPNTGFGTDHGWAGMHFMMGGSVNGGKVLGLYPTDFEQHEGNPIALSRGRMIPTSPWDAMWKGTAEWFGISDGDEMDKVLPMHKNFPSTVIYDASELFVSEPVAGGAPGGLFT